MKLLHNEDLSKYTTIRIGGTAKNFYIPENEYELLEIYKKYKNSYFLGGGSNILINNRVFDNVVYLKAFNPDVKFLEDGTFLVGGSVTNQQLIRLVNAYGYGGVEFLYSVPGLVGGSIAMNAGQGGPSGKSISDYLEEVTAIIDGEFKTLSNSQCGFEYRSSLFKGKQMIVCHAKFRFPKQEKHVSEKLIKERISRCKETQDNSFPNFGSVFSVSNGRIMKFAKKFCIGGKIKFSKKTPNWILKIDKHATYNDVIKTVKKVERIHKLFRKKIKREGFFYPSLNIYFLQTPVLIAASFTAFATDL